MQYLEHTKKIIVYLKLKANWASCILFANSGNPLCVCMCVNCSVVSDS